MQSTSKLVLPVPTCTLPDPSKKSHARRQPAGHIPRPRNAFILFRCDFVRQKKIPLTVETDHRNISRIVGKIWRGMNADEKEPWVKLAEAEKAHHMKLHPDYRFSRGVINGKRRMRRGNDMLPMQKADLASVSSDEELLAFDDRSASCPVGARRVPIVNLESSNGYGNPMRTRDDLERRPSRVTLYQSTFNDLEEESAHKFFSDITKQHHFASTIRERQDEIYKKAKSTVDQVPKKEAFNEDKDNHDGIFCGPRLNGMQYPIPILDWKEDYPGISWGGVSVKDVNNHLSQDFSTPVFSDPFSSTLPPLPRSTLPDFLTLGYRASFLAERKTSQFFSPRSGTWKLPPLVHSHPHPGAPAALNPLSTLYPERLFASSAANNIYDECADSLYHGNNRSGASRNARDSAEETIREYARDYLNEMTLAGS